MVTVPRDLMRWSSSTSLSEPRARCPRAGTRRRDGVEAGADRALVGGDVLGAVRGDRLRALPRRARRRRRCAVSAGVRAGHHHRPAERVPELGRRCRSASTRCTSHGAAISCVNVASFTSTSAPGRSFGSIGSQNSSCIAIADHVRDTSGGVSESARRRRRPCRRCCRRASCRRRGRRASRSGLRASRAGEHLAGELHALPADAGDEQLTFHGAVPLVSRGNPASANCTTCSTSSWLGCAPLDEEAVHRAHRELAHRRRVANGDRRPRRRSRRAAARGAARSSPRSRRGSDRSGARR